MTSHKAEAIRALEQVRDRLGDGAPLDGLARFTLKAQVEYALSEIAAVEELKRARPSRGRANGGASAEKGTTVPLAIGGENGEAS